MAVTFTLKHRTKTRTYCALAPDDVSLLLSDDVLKSTPPRPMLGAAGATDDAVDVDNREPNVNPPAPPRVVCPKPATAGASQCQRTQSRAFLQTSHHPKHVRFSPVGAVLEKRLAPSVGAAKDAVVAVAPPRPRVKPVAAGCCGAVEVRTEPNVKPAPAVVAGVAVREKGVAEAVGLFWFKARLKPAAAVVAGVPEGKG